MLRLLRFRQEKQWWLDGTRCDAAGRAPVPIELLALGVFRKLG